MVVHPSGWYFETAIDISGHTLSVCTEESQQKLLRNEGDYIIKDYDIRSGDDKLNIKLHARTKVCNSLI